MNKYEQISEVTKLNMEQKKELDPKSLKKQIEHLIGYLYVQPKCTKLWEVEKEISELYRLIHNFDTVIISKEALKDKLVVNIEPTHRSEFKRLSITINYVQYVMDDCLKAHQDEVIEVTKNGFIELLEYKLFKKSEDEQND